ncbi:ATP-binding protein [Marinactinospora thermotolerans]|uniref:Anti-sigma regulatory factor (Ser/Thr protein kinase) n=1 Tax=Marinactinospora thermotolerans DSM 45154 TaxID=1122192 RepID=A0A1T4THI6_9ACTN|nr:ATP-binding protein [Marinactinospora thermotolerans]SKA39778.1 Anti-sigma regulatory factor (Ser/Thr protein kinase) [Marinactinospora thermotolerans DSM 45154]
MTAFTVFSTSLPGIPESVGEARRFVVGVLRVAPEKVPAVVIDNVEVIVSELATNAIRYTHSGDRGATYDLYFSVDTRRLTGSVRTEPPLAGFSPSDCERMPAVEGEGGRGLYLVRALATEYSDLRPYEHGTCFTLRWTSLALVSKGQG